MLYHNSGTSVPKSYDSPPKAPNFKVKPRRKFPITAITVIHQAPGEWTVYFFRVGKNIKFFDTHLKRVEMLTNLMREFQNLNFVDISPDLMGWTAYVNQAEYPPPKVSSDEPERDPFGVPYNEPSGPELCPYCGSDEIGASWVHDLHKTSDDQPDHYDCANCGASWEGA